MSNEEWNELDESYRSALSGALETAHPAVEQAGGDRWDALQSIMEWTAAKNIPDDRKLCLIRNAARAALAQPSPVRSSLLINGYQLRAALDFIAPDGTAEQLKSEACIEWRQQDADFLEAGLYAFCAEYPEEGGVLLDEEPTTAQPSPLQSEQAEAERPEVVARVVHSNPVVLGQCGPLNANDELMTVAQHAASVARWAEMFNRVEQERDAALARVAELEQQEPLKLSDDVREFLQEGINSVMGGEDADMDYEFASQLGKLLDPVYAAPVAPVQHSVPEISGIGRDAEHPRAVVLYLRNEPSDEDMRAIQNFLRAMPADVPVKAQHSVPVPVVTPEMVMAAMAVFRLDVSPFKSMEAALTAALRKAAAPGNSAQHSVPEGWKLVPVDPTEDVLEAIHNGGYVGDDQELRWFYQSILAAAPAPGGE
ncbi:hypothetical protein [Pseudomonas aeruginosa]|uniref:hypothetical protein n=1 Tax=Pseudomonas aeruginosa TaxID=287 RepID=UPI0015966546|nr:hypothetical protein [Pseudomonas aeruginosa]